MAQRRTRPPHLHSPGGSGRTDETRPAPPSRFVAVGPGHVGLPGLETLMLGFAPDQTPLFPIQRPKVQRPPLRPDTLSRERLLDWLAAKIHQRAVFVVAEAGYGKTTLLADFARRTRVRTFWYRLDEQDRDPVAFLNYLVAAGREQVPDFAPTTAALLRDLGTGGTSHETLVATLVRELPGLGAEGGALIIDDYHLVDDVPEIRSIVQAILHDGPERLTLVLLSRRQPRLAVARLRTLGELVTLTAEDLRFRTEETERLFRESYRRPLEPDVLDELSRRTEGWAASLQLVRTALRDRTPTEVRAFVRGLTGTHHELYDYLAEEVVGDLEEPLRDFLMRTSILRVVEPDVASVAASLDERNARRRIEAAERVGLLGRRGETRWSHRYHPLVQQFLVERLRRTIGTPAVLELHRAVARYGEYRDWRLAIHHWAAAGDGPDVHRVLASAIPSVMGTGEFALAESYLERFPAPERTPAFEVLLSRLDFYRNRIDTALDRARWAAESDPPSPIALINLAALEFMAGNVERSARVVGRLDQDDSHAANLRDIAEGMRQIIASGDDGDLDEFVEKLSAILEAQLSRGETHYAGVTALNLSIALRQQGLPEPAELRSTQAIELLEERSLGPELAAAFASRAWSHAHVGDLAAAERDIARALETTHELARAEVLGEAAEIHGWYGRIDRALDYLERARLISEATPVLKVSWRLTAAQLALRQRDTESALGLLEDLEDAKWFGTTGQHVRLLSLVAFARALGGQRGWRDALERALIHAARQKAHLWTAFLRLLEASRGNAGVLSMLVSDLVEDDAGLTCMLSDEIVERLPELEARVRAGIHEVARKRPEPWRAPLRRALLAPSPSTRLAAARLLDEVGEADDVRPLRQVAKKFRRSGPDARLGKSLARRLAPRILVRDLGRTEIAIGASTVPGSSIRRKVLALLLYLMSRPGFSATHDQVLDSLWPEQGPKEALNSLNQTIYFLRRVLEADYHDDTSPEYVHHESDLLWLDPELIDCQSRRCSELASAARQDLTGAAPETLANMYTDRFALDFLYEDWAQGYRERLHATYLEVMERATVARLGDGDPAGALHLAEAAVSVDPTADALQVFVIRLCRQLGAHSAAAERYATYQEYVRSELGAEAPPLDAL
jgi:ATP/maltotriose-dependent transcriptional regulator MalT/DNA-binding SARP family transcriptional activator